MYVSVAINYNQKTPYIFMANNIMKQIQQIGSLPTLTSKKITNHSSSKFGLKNILELPVFDVLNTALYQYHYQHEIHDSMRQKHLFSKFNKPLHSFLLKSTTSDISLSYVLPTQNKLHKTFSFKNLCNNLFFTSSKLISNQSSYHFNQFKHPLPIFLF